MAIADDFEVNLAGDIRLPLPPRYDKFGDKIDYRLLLEDYFDGPYNEFGDFNHIAFYRPWGKYNEFGDLDEF